MSFLFIYILKLSVSLAVVFLFYHFVLRRLTFYNWNRWYLLAYTGLSFFVSFINISPVLERNEWTKSNMLQWVPVLETRSVSGAVKTSPGLFSAGNVVVLLLLAGMLLMLVRLLVQLFSFRRMMKKAQPVATGFIPGEDIRLYQVDDNIIPFSFGNSIFINSKLHTETELQEIIRHEFVHVKQKHSADIIWAEILCLLNWYNPFAWMLKASIRQNLEFVADNKVLENGISKKQYQYLLLKVIGNDQFSIAQKFNFSSLKKRIAMMNKIKSAKVHLLRFLFVLPLLALILVSFRKEIGDSFTRNQKKIQPSPAAVNATDTIPDVMEPNSKGYIINVKDNKGNCMLVIKDKTGKEVKRLLLTEWKENAEKYEALYGEIPMPPPPPPASVTESEMVVSPTPPLPPAPVQLPGNVQKINVNNNKATIWLKNGQKENYDLSNPEQKAKFEKKYGEIIPPPPPPPKAVSVGYNDLLNSTCSEFEITDKKAVLHLKNGVTEEYDLTNTTVRKKFEDKYGKIINVNTNVNTNVDAAVSVVAPVAVTGSLGSLTALTVYSSSKTITPVAAVSSVSGHTIAIAPMAASGLGELAVVDDYGYTITGKEDVLVTITKNSTREQLEDYKKQMKEKGIELNYDEVEYEKGVLVKITGTMKSKDGRSNFVAVDFNTLTLAMIKKGEKTYFKVSVEDNKIVI